MPMSGNEVDLIKRLPGFAGLLKRFQKIGASKKITVKLEVELRWEEDQVFSVLNIPAIEGKTESEALHAKLMREPKALEFSEQVHRFMEDVRRFAEKNAIDESKLWDIFAAPFSGNPVNYV